MGAARERREGHGESKARVHFGELFERRGRIHEGCRPKAGALEQAGVARQQHPALGGAEGHQRVVTGIVAVSGIDAQQAQIAGKAAEVHVEHEAWRIAGGLHEPRKHADGFATAQPMHE
nr:hypothetical protein [Lysobacter xinjiangensis]